MQMTRFVFTLGVLAVGTTTACDHKAASPSPAPAPAPVPTPVVVLDAAAPAAVTPLDASAPGPSMAMPAAAEVAPLAAASNALGLDLYAAASKQPGNLALSPTSISIALAMTWAGAAGTTAASMQKVLHVTGDATMIASTWGSVAAALQSPGRGLELRIANRLFGEATQTFEPPFLALTRDRFGAPLEPIDFKAGAGAARNHINAWVADQTHQRITDLMPVGSPSVNSRLVLVNAIYFLADWSEPFEQRSTAPAAFHPAKAVTKEVPMMHKQGTLSAGTADGVLLAELPYHGNTASMIVVVPKAIDGLPAVEAALTPAVLATWRKALRPQDAALALPKFTIDPATALSLGDALKALGMADAFDAHTADFSGIAKPATQGDGLAIGGVYHKAFVKVDEKGTEAAAATAVDMVVRGAMPARPPLVITADHPFLFFIVDQDSGLVLFMGRVSDPT